MPAFIILGTVTFKESLTPLQMLIYWSLAFCLEREASDCWYLVLNVRYMFPLMVFVHSWHWCISVTCVSRFLYLYLFRELNEFLGYVCVDFLVCLLRQDFCYVA